MFALSVLVPTMAVGAIAWGVVGVIQGRGRQSLTPVTAASFYAHVMLMVGGMIALAGMAILVKIGLTGIDLSFGYTPIVGPSAPYGPPSPETQRMQDLILATVLFGLGTVVAIGHGFLAGWLRTMEGGGLTWITRGALIATTAVTGLAAILSTVVGSYQLSSYFLLGQSAGPFADAIGMAVVFLPAWLACLAVLVRLLRRPQPRPAPA
ncbi:MAG TPA: hypothetical protein VFD49_02915 [Candidatus Dormibacteraeota bacterium]|nr:hypothetical protein [Candidatus Dormibacteraeota bacterium]